MLAPKMKICIFRHFKIYQKAPILYLLDQSNANPTPIRHKSYSHPSQINRLSTTNHSISSFQEKESSKRALKTQIKRKDYSENPCKTAAAERGCQGTKSILVYQRKNRISLNFFSHH